MTFQEQIKHPLWQKKRLEVLEHNEFACQECYCDELTLHVHHPIYKKNAKLWEYDVSELKCLCEICHQETHEIDAKIKMILVKTPLDFKPEIYKFIESLLIQYGILEEGEL